MAESSVESVLRNRARAAAWAGYLAQIAFGLWLLLGLTTSSWRYGPFSWWPLWREARLAGGPAALGILNLLLPLALAGWLARRLLARNCRWTWGHPALALPFFSLSLLGLLTLVPMSERLPFIYGGALFLTWLVYLVVLNERPALALTVALVILVQSTVALGQFFLQRDLGLAFLGELPLRPWWEGASVLLARGQPWLRAYGLVAHPNLLGALLTVFLLFVLATGRSQEWATTGIQGNLRSLLLAIGLLGLLVSFSRAAWLAMGAGLSFAFWLRLRRGAVPPLGDMVRRWLWLLLPLLLLTIFYRDLALSRVLALDSPLEAQSISDRLRDAGLALDLIARSPWRGVGLGRYTEAAILLEPTAARVHNVTLLVTAELGLPGLFLWLVLALAPFWLAWRGKLDPAGLPAWLAMLVVGLFDTTLWWGSNWQTAILFGLLLAHLHRPLLDSPRSVVK